MTANGDVLVRADWDAEAECWYATSDDVPGLATGADTIEELIERLKTIIPELLQLNGMDSSDHVSFELLARRRTVVGVAA